MLVLFTLGYGSQMAARQPAVPAPNLAGTWTLDAFLSDDPEQVARALQFDTGELAAGELSSAREAPPEGSGVGREGEGRGQFGGRGQRASDNSEVKSEDRQKLAALTESVRFAPLRLTISQTASEVTIASDTGAPQTLHTDGKAEQRQLEAGAVKRTATWEGPQLRIAYAVGQAGTLTYRYSLAPITRQLVVRVDFERSPGQPGPFEIKLVYDRAAG